MATATGGGLLSVLNQLSVGPQPKEGRSVRKYRIAVLGPSYVGKTQLINRFINNSFSPYYEETQKPMIY